MGQWAGLVISERTAEVPYSLMGAFNLCLDWPGSVEVTEVAMEHAEGGLRIDAFGLRPRLPLGPQPETFTETLAELGYQPDMTTITLVCDEDLGGPSDEELARAGFGAVDRGVTEFAIEYNKPTDKTARGAGLRLTYTSGGESYVYRVGFEIILCEFWVVGVVVPECEVRGPPGA
jgi:hypothetical protein